MTAALADSLAQVGIRPSAQAQAFAQHFTTLANQAISKSPTSSTAMSLTGIDATMGALGPIHLTNPDTQPARSLNVTLLGGTVNLDSLDGHSLDPTPEPGLLLVEDRTNEPAAIAVEYRLSLRQSAVALALTYGLTDNLNVSLLMPVITTNLGIRVSGGGEAGSTHLHRLGPGDLTTRLKYKLPAVWGVESAVNLDAQFPVGDPEDLQGTGDYWIAPAFSARKILLGGRGDVTANVAMDFDLNDAAQTQALYGIGTSWLLLPWLAVSLEFLGRSQLDDVKTLRDTDVFYLTPTGIHRSPLFGFTFSRTDYLDFAFGVRLVRSPLAIILGGVYHLNDTGLRSTSVVPTIGAGATW
jgi:hypothetical protein